MAEEINPDVKMLVLGIEDELARTQHKWKTCLNIFDTGYERVLLLSDIDLGFFTELFEMYLESVALSYGRLLDDHTMQGNLNLSFPYLLEKTALRGFQEYQKWLTELKAIQSSRAVEKLRAIRNKSIAHNDLPTYLRKGVISGVGFPKNDVAEIHSALSKLLNQFKDSLKMSPPVAPYGESPYHYGSRLLQRLERGK